MKKMLLILVLLLTGCVSNTTGVLVEQSQMANFKAGVTTEADVIQVLGNPIVRSTKSDGTKMLMYYYSQSQARGIIGLGGVVNMDISTTTFLFDATDKLLSHETTQSKYGSGQPATTQ
jgi:outer membrane protein assembly factor BamE (lipoprotein component of BamABCDE complex)